MFKKIYWEIVRGINEKTMIVDEKGKDSASNEAKS